MIKFTFSASFNLLKFRLFFKVLCLIIVFSIAVLKSPKNVKSKKAWATRYFVKKRKLFYAYKFQVNVKTKPKFVKFWLNDFMYLL